DGRGAGSGEGGPGGDPGTVGGEGRPFRLRREILSGARPGDRPDTRPQAVLSALPEAPSAHRGRRVHADVGDPPYGWRARLAPDDEPDGPARPEALAGGESRRGQHRPDSGPPAAPHRTGGLCRRDPEVGASRGPDCIGATL